MALPCSLESIRPGYEEGLLESVVASGFTYIVKPRAPAARHSARNVKLSSMMER